MQLRILGPDTNRSNINGDWNGDGQVNIDVNMNK